VRIEEGSDLQPDYGQAERMCRARSAFGGRAKKKTASNPSLAKILGKLQLIVNSVNEFEKVGKARKDDRVAQLPTSRI